MKNSKLNQIISLFFTLAVVGVLVTSCEKQKQENLSEITLETSNDLPERLAANTNFQEIIKIIHAKQIVESDMTIIADRTSIFLADFPELIESDKVNLQEIIQQTIFRYSNESYTLSLRCDDPAGFSSCSSNAYSDYLHSFYNCKTNSCRNFMTQVWFEAAQLCINLFC